jgi:hypothetical protein
LVDSSVLLPYFCRNFQQDMKQHNIRITLSVLLTVAAVISIGQLLFRPFTSDQQFLLIVQSLLFIYLSATNYSDRFMPLLGRKQTHYAILILLTLVLSVNNYFLVTKGNPDTVPLNSLSEYFNS